MSTVPGGEQYQSLAKFCHSVISTLLDETDRSRRSQVLEDALSAVEAVNSGDLYRFGTRRAAAFNANAEVSTLKQVWADKDMNRAIQLLRLILGREDDVDTDLKHELINLFSKLRAKALWNFEQPHRSIRLAAPIHAGR